MTSTARPPGSPLPGLDTALADRVVVADGAMGTMLQASAATLSDFDGHEGCNEILNVTRPDVVRAVHEGYFEAGVDCRHHQHVRRKPRRHWASTASSDRIGELSEAGARIARAAADAWSTPDRPRWVLGSIGPGTKLPTLGHARFGELRDAYLQNAAGLLARRRRRAHRRDLARTCSRPRRRSSGRAAPWRRPAGQVPLIAQVTIETTGTMLLGTRDRRRADRAGAAGHRR